MKKMSAAVLAMGMAILWAGGCQEEQASPDVKQSRLIAAQSGDLKAQLQQETKKHAEEIKNLNTQMQTETKRRDDEIKNLKSQMQKRDEEIKNLNSQIQKRGEEIGGIGKQLQTEKEKLNADKEKLNADVDNLSKQLAECLQEKQAVAEKAEKDIIKRSEEFTEEIFVPLLHEKEELKTEIAQLKEKLSNCEGKK